MAKMTEFTINDIKIELYYNVIATMGISELCGGDIDNMPKLLDEYGMIEKLKFVCEILCELANGAVAVHNTNISLGLETGEKKQKYNVDFFLTYCGLNDIDKAFGAAFEAMGIGSEFTVPDNVKADEKDIDLVEIEAEKNESKKS